MTTQNFHNPLLDDDDEEVIAPTARRVLNLPRTASAQPATAPKGEPKFGEKGFRKGVPNSRRGTPRARATEIDAKILSHCAQWPACTADAVSVLHRTAMNQISNGDLMTVGGAEVRLAKLQKMGLIEKDRALDGSIVWGTTDAGIHAARQHGYLLDDHAVTKNGFRDMSYGMMDHFRYIGLVAALLKSPEGFFKDTLNLDPISPEQLISESQIRREQQWVSKMLTEEAKASDKTARDGDNLFGAWRTKTLAKAISEVNAGKLALNEIVERYPELRTLGQPPIKITDEQGNPVDKPVKGTHFPDLVVDFEANRTTKTSSSIAFEIELSRKSNRELEAILRTYAKEFEHSLIYGHVVYPVINMVFEKRLRQIDKWNDFGLFDRGLITVIPITDRWGTLAKLKKKVSD